MQYLTSRLGIHDRGGTAMHRIAFVLLLLVSEREDTYSPDLAEW